MKDSLLKKYLYKLTTNSTNLLVNLLTAGIIPRALGVKDYGIFNFVTTLLSQALMFLDLRSSTCFYVKLSQKNNDNNLFNFYLIYAFALNIIFCFLLFLTYLFSFNELIFVDVKNSIIILAVFYTILSWILELFIKILDANGATVFLEKYRVINKIIVSIFIVGFYYLSILDIVTYFYIQISFIFILVLILVKYSTFQLKYSIDFKPLFKNKIFNNYLKSFYIYTAPLAIYVILAFISLSWDRWLLIKFGGSFQNGLYAFSATLVNFSLIFVGAITPLFTREISVAAGKDDINSMKNIFSKYVPILYCITAYICAFIFIERVSIINIFGGEEYKNASNILGVLAFYPLISVFSLLNGSVIYATERTALFLKISLIFTPLSMSLGYFYVFSDYFDVNMAGKALALKDLLREIISCVIILYINSKFLKINFKNFIIRMFLSIFPFILISFSLKLTLQYFNILEFNIILNFLVSGLLYSFVSLLFIYYFPIIIGLSKSQKKSLLDQLYFKIFN